MQELWLDLEHTNPNSFSRDDYTLVTYLVKSGLRKRHGEVKPKFAFLRSEEIITERKTDVEHTVHIPRLTVCYLRPEEPSPMAGHTAVGLAFCSEGDNPNKWFGRALAFKRAVSALVSRQCTEENIIRGSTSLDDFLQIIGSPVVLKSFAVEDPNYVLVRNVKEEINGNGDLT